MQRRTSSLGVACALLGCFTACSPVRDGRATPTLGSIAAGGSAGGGGAAAAGSQGDSGQSDAGSSSGMAAGGAGSDAPVLAPSDGLGQPVPADAGALPDDAGADARADAAPAAADPALLRLAAISARLAPLAARTASFWLTHGADVESGGFRATLDRQGNPIAPEDKGLIQQARHLWMLSTWYERREPTEQLRQRAQEQFAFLRRSFLDTADGAFVYKVSRDGSRIVDGRKQLFAESYAIYALATYGRVFDDADARALALARFASIDAARHDTQNGGYDQRGDPGDLPAGAAKDTNTHLHLLEAFTAVYEATADARVAARLNELIDLFATRLLQPGGYVHAAFGLDWAPFGAPRVSYGHDLETAWLLLDAARVVGRDSDPVVTGASLAIAATSGEQGFDAQRGGYFEAGVPGGASDDVDKVWWVQFEALEGLWWANALSHDAVYLDRLERTLDWVEFAEDEPVGEWFATTNPDGTAAGADYKSDEWKEGYHSVRSLVFLQDWIDAELTARAAY